VFSPPLQGSIRSPAISLPFEKEKGKKKRKKKKKNIKKKIIKMK